LVDFDGLLFHYGFPFSKMASNERDFCQLKDIIADFLTKVHPFLMPSFTVIVADPFAAVGCQESAFFIGNYAVTHYADPVAASLKAVNTIGGR
jgi:hypothetical protein